MPDTKYQFFDFIKRFNFCFGAMQNNSHHLRCFHTKNQLPHIVQQSGNKKTFFVEHFCFC